MKHQDHTLVSSVPNAQNSRRGAQALEVALLVLFGLFLAAGIYTAFTALLFPTVELVSLALTCFFIGALCFLGARLIASRPHKSKRLKISLIVCSSALLICSGVYGYQLYVNLSTISESSYEIDFNEYRPFLEQSHLARLDYEASLQFSGQDDLPILDGATALLPVYASVVEATYPEDIAMFYDGEPETVTITLPNGSKQERVYFSSVIQASGTSYAYDSLISGGCDIIFCAYPSEGQLEQAEEWGVELEFTPLGSEGFVFFTHQGNPVNSLTVEELRAIYQGEITKWSELGGTFFDIVPYQRNEGSGSQSEFLRFMGSSTPMQPNTMQVSTSMGGIVERVADYQNNVGALGFSFRFFTKEMMRDHRIKLLSVDGVAPTLTNIASGEYPLVNNFYAVTRSDNTNRNVDLLLEWLQSNEGQELVARTGYAPL